MGDSNIVNICKCEQLRFLAAEFGLAGKNTLENAQADEIVDAVSDLQSAMSKAFFPTMGKDEKAIENVLDNVYPAGLVSILLFQKYYLNFPCRPTLRKCWHPEVDSFSLEII